MTTKTPFVPGWPSTGSSGDSKAQGTSPAGAADLPWAFREKTSTHHATAKPPVTVDAPGKSIQARSREVSSSSREEHAEDSDHGVRLEYVTENGTVARLRVICSCGKVTEVDCRYELPPGGRN